ncbi:hypothetical protein [Streptomyces sp. NPDC046821]|uniref:hypothetical protein n=1 Tax=Streptomyces sp. NPDC046821 TaxID=3154702 RepID=UPI0033C65263
MYDVLWLTGLTGSALCLAAHVRTSVRSWLPSAVALGAMALMAPGASHREVFLACLASLAALTGTLVVRCPQRPGRRADLLMMSVLTAAMLRAHGGHSHHSGSPYWYTAGLAVFFVTCRLVLRAGALLVRQLRNTPSPRGARSSVPKRLLDETGGVLMMVGMACMPM